MWVTAVMLLHFVFSVFSVSSGLPGGSFIPTLVTGGLLGQIVGLVGVRYGVIGQENVSYIMLVSMSAFLVAVVRTPLTAIVLITEITGHFEVFLPFGGCWWVDLLFYGTSANEAFQRLPL